MKAVPIIRPNARRERCVRGHLQTPENRYRDKWCRLCRTQRAREYRADGRMHEPPERSRRRYWDNVEQRRLWQRAFYHANKARYQKQRQVWRLRKRVDLNDNEVAYLRELVAEVAAIPVKKNPSGCCK